MATRLQCLIRKRAAYNERMRLLATWIEQLQNNAAVTIQRITRGYSSKVVAKRMADERQRFLEEQEKARQTNQEQEAATLIQSHVRQRIAKMHCANRLVEIGQQSLDGNLFDFFKSINDDYIRFERTITTTIEREEKLAQVSAWCGSHLVFM